MILKKGADKASMQELIKNLTKHSAKRGLDAYKYSGTVKFKEDGLKLQKQFRHEWK